MLSSRDVRRRRTPQGEDAPPVAVEAAPAAPPAPAAPVTAPAVPRTPTDLEPLRRVAEMGRDEIAALMEEFAPRTRATRLRRGQRVKGRVTRIAAGTVFVDLGDKADASIERHELDADVNPGDTLEAYVVSLEEGEVRLTLSLGGDAVGEMLEEAKQNRIPVQGKVTGHNDHGFEVQLPGGVRGFCPASQMDVSGAVSDAAEWVGRSLSFRILDVRGREAVVSHRAIAEEEAREGASRALAALKEGDLLDGVVTSLREFGAFVRVAPGVEGLVHISNLSSKRVTNPAEVVKEGQEVRVKILAVDHARRRLNLGLKQAEMGVAAPAAREGAGPSTSGANTFGTFGSLLTGVTVKKK